MNLILFKGIGPCSACEQVVAELDGADVQFTLNEDNAALYHAGEAVGARARPILIWYAVGAGVDADSIIEALRRDSPGYNPPPAEVSPGPPPKGNAGFKRGA